jgi:hypothetical protein
MRFLHVLDFVLRFLLAEKNEGTRKLLVPRVVLCSRPPFAFRENGGK